MITGVKKEDIFDAIEGGFGAFYTVARKKTQEKWKKMPRIHKYAAARALVTLRDISKNPERYFSPESTAAAWKLRAAEYAKKNGVAEGWAYYFIDSPTEIVVDMADAAFIQEPVLNSKFHDFCDVVKQWYCKAASSDLVQQAAVWPVAEEIVKYSREIRKQADIAKDGRVMYWLMHSKFKNMILPKPYENQR